MPSSQYKEDHLVTITKLKSRPGFILFKLLGKMNFCTDSLENWLGKVQRFEPRYGTVGSASASSVLPRPPSQEILV